MRQTKQIFVSVTKCDKQFWQNYSISLWHVKKELKKKPKTNIHSYLNLTTAIKLLWVVLKSIICLNFTFFWCFVKKLLLPQFTPSHVKNYIFKKSGCLDEFTFCVSGFTLHMLPWLCFNILSDWCIAVINCHWPFYIKLGFMANYALQFKNLKNYPKLLLYRRLAPRLATETIEKGRKLHWRYWDKDLSSSRFYFPSSWSAWLWTRWIKSAN